MAETKINGLIPVLGITSYEEAVAHYVDWLGFKLDWEWREAPGKPVVMSITRDDVSIMLNEHDDAIAGGWLCLYVTNLAGLEAEWEKKRPGAAAVVVEAPYDIPSMMITDPFGNRVDFQQPISKEEQAERRVRMDQMRAFIRAELDAGRPCPTPEAVVGACGRPPGMAMDVLCEFPEYAAAAD